MHGWVSIDGVAAEERERAKRVWPGGGGGVGGVGWGWEGLLHGVTEPDRV